MCLQSYDTFVRKTLTVFTYNPSSLQPDCKQMAMLITNSLFGGVGPNRDLSHALRLFSYWTIAASSKLKVLFHIEWTLSILNYDN